MSPTKSSLDTEVVTTAHVSRPTAAHEPAASPRRSRLRPFAAALALLAAAGLGGLLLAPQAAPLRARLGLKAPAAATPKTAASPPPAASPPEPATPWDGRITIRPDQFQSLGLSLTVVEAQTAPTRLEITGTTAYDPSTLTRVRPRFTGVASKVHVRIGQVVHVGDPLVELFSTDLATAKSSYEERGAQWEHDRAQLDRIKPLFEQKAVSEKDYYDAFNDEKKSQLEYRLARDNLVVFGLNDDEIAHIASEDGTQKARLTLRAPAEGLVTERTVAEGSLYEPTDVLLTIAPQNRFWVIGNVYESDQPRIHEGQDWEIRFPFIDPVVMAKVEQVDARVDPATRTIQIRTTIPNVGGVVKADMLAYGSLLVPPEPRCTVVPRQAVVVSDETSYVFVRDDDAPDQYVRREVDLVEETRDHAVLRKGVGPGEQVVTRGSLIVAQIFEDAAVQNGDETH